MSFGSAIAEVISGEGRGRGKRALGNAELSRVRQKYTPRNAEFLDAGAVYVAHDHEALVPRNGRNQPRGDVSKMYAEEDTTHTASFGGACTCKIVAK